jgi:hypothetical protein
MARLTRSQGGAVRRDGLEGGKRGVHMRRKWMGKSRKGEAAVEEWEEG